MLDGGLTVENPKPRISRYPKQIFTFFATFAKGVVVGPRQSDIAKLAGTSVPTVSKALNGRSDVSPGVRARVQAAAETLGYHLPASRDRGGREIHVVIDNLVNYYTPVVLAGLLQEAAARGITLSLHSERAWLAGGTGPRPGSTEWLNSAADRQCTGVVLMTVPTSGLDATVAHNRKLPLVLIDPIEEAPVDIASIGATNWQGGRQATEHLLQLGHRRIAVVTGPERSRPSIERLHGYRSALDSAGIAFDPDLVHHGDFRYESGLTAARYFLGMNQPPTAVFAMSDFMALGIIDACRRRSIDIPGDLSLVGFDDGFGSRSFTPPLTTVRQPLETMGATALAMVDDLAAEQAKTWPKLQLETQLVVRSSTAPPRARLEG